MTPLETNSRSGQVVQVDLTKFCAINNLVWLRYLFQLVKIVPVGKKEVSRQQPDPGRDLNIVLVMVRNQNAQMYEMDNGKPFSIIAQDEMKLENIMDSWIVSFTQSLVKFVVDEMGKYHLYKVVPKLVKFVDNLTNWYVRMNRPRLKGQGGESDARQALSALYHVLLNMVRLMAPFTPFMTELLYKDLKNLLPETNPNRAESVHFLSIPNINESQIDVVIERKVNNMQRVIELGRVIRDRRTLPFKYPLAKVVVISSDESVGQDVEELSDYIKLELNVLEVETTDDKDKFGVKIKAQPDLKLLGARLRGDSKGVIEAIRKMSELDLQDYQKDPDNYLVSGKTLEEGELRLVYSFGDDNTPEDKEANEYEAHSDGTIVVLLHVKPDQSMFDQGLAREFIGRIQKLRKKANLVPTDPVDVEYFIDNEDQQEREDIQRVVDENTDHICATIKGSLTRLSASLPRSSRENEILRDAQQLKTSMLEILLLRRT